jgi:ureidoglycolate lyase
MTRTISSRPLDPAAYAAYGTVVHAGEPSTARSANHGDAQAWDALATIENLRGASARCTASLFRCRAHLGAELPIRWLERHALSTQMFVPMGNARYLVVVARGGDAPDLATLAAFVVEGARAITYAPGTWHHPMVALDRDADFVNVIFTDGSAGDCDEIAYAEPPALVSIVR